MSNLIAKPIIKNQLWVITDGVKKIGNIEANSSHTGYNVTIGGLVHTFSTTKSIEKDVRLVFENPVTSDKDAEIPFAHWPTDSETFNNVYDVRRKMHVYTKTPTSKCYHAAGYFNIVVENVKQTMLSPKYLYIQRYVYDGPYRTLSEALDALNTV